MIFAFDIYGTLFDTRGIREVLHDYLGEQADQVARLWRDKQLEYSFRRGLMRQYRDFSVCTREALDTLCQALALPLDAPAKQTLLAAWDRLPAYADVAPALQAMQAKNAKLYAFSNGPAMQVAQLLDGAGLAEYFQDIVSVDEIRSFKPDPAVYYHFVRRSGGSPAEIRLVSANPFDVSGAAACGWQAVWLQRDPGAVFDAWEFQPQYVIGNLADLLNLPG